MRRTNQPLSETDWCKSKSTFPRKALLGQGVPHGSPKYFNLKKVALALCRHLLNFRNLECGPKRGLGMRRANLPLPEAGGCKSKSTSSRKA